MSSTKNKRPSTQGDVPPLSKIFTSSLKGAALGLVISLILALIMTLIALNSGDPSALLSPLALATLYVSAFVSGFIATRINGSSSLVCGIISGGIFMIFYMAVKFILPHADTQSHNFFVSFLYHVLTVVMAILGGYAAQTKRTKKHKPRR